MFSSELITVGLVFTVVLLLVVGVYSFIGDIWGGARGRIRRRLAVEAQQGVGAPSRELFGDLDEIAAQAWEDEASGARTWRGRLQRLVYQSGVPLSADRLLIRSGVLAAGGALLAGVVTWSWIASLLAATIGALLPLVNVFHHRHVRLERLQAQLADAFEMMSRVMRAGQSTSHALRLVSEEMPEPVSGEFGTCYEQQNLGISPVVAYRDLAQRTGLFEIKMFVVAMLVHREAGGNLAELLERLASVIRDRYRLRGVIRSLTAEGRFQAAILLALPVVLFGLVSLVQPGYLTVLFAYPWLFVIAAASELMGALWIRKIVNIDI